MGRNAQSDRWIAGESIGSGRVNRSLPVTFGVARKARWRELNPADFHEQHVLLDRCVSGKERARSVQDLRAYFREDRPSDQLFSGRRFDRVAGRGNAPGDQDEITAGDVLALTFLSIRYRLPELTLDVLEVHAERISELLRKIPA